MVVINGCGNSGKGGGNVEVVYHNGNGSSGDVVVIVVISLPLGKLEPTGQ